MKKTSVGTRICLANVLTDSDRREEARTMLTDIYGWFTESFDTADLKDTKLLLDDVRS